MMDRQEMSLEDELKRCDELCDAVLVALRKETRRRIFVATTSQLVTASLAFTAATLI